MNFTKLTCNSMSQMNACGILNDLHCRYIYEVHLLQVCKQLLLFQWPRHSYPLLGTTPPEGQLESNEKHVNNNNGGDHINYNNW